MNNGASAGKGGVATFILLKWANMLIQSGTLFGGRVHWFILSRMPGGNIGFINIYAPTDRSTPLKNMGYYDERPPHILQMGNAWRFQHGGEKT